MTTISPEEPVKLKANDPAYFRDYYHRHNQYVMCECGSTVTASYLVRHSKQPKHLRLLTEKNRISNLIFGKTEPPLTNLINIV